ncbi:MAG: tricarballylate utilization 4Fe-4S protein TcuB [Acidobacteria bacterium]|nr:tricarballylate utilization 4Fe-4S protein TcuB [Acidobacteriota bacterium]
MLVCNACRYCEGYCAVFPAMERRLAFPPGDLRFLANLCHDCGECLYACQYAPPHAFAINVPRTLAEVRLESYERYAWPAPLARAFRRHTVATSLALSAAMTAVMLLATAGAGSVEAPAAPADFYAVLPHGAMVALFGAVFTFVLAALAVGVARFRREIDEASRASGAGRTGRARGASWRALRDALTLRNLHAHGTDCTYAGEEARTSWRRRFHHCTFYGFLLCVAATSVGALYHLVFGWEAPYGYTSLPVLLGTAGGAGLVIGPAGQCWIGRTRDPETADPAQRSPDRAFLLLLFLSSATGLLLLAWRHTAAMPTLLVVHLGVVLALFVTLPYGKFVHGVYRTAALVRDALESRGVWRYPLRSGVRHRPD